MTKSLVARLKSRPKEARAVLEYLSQRGLSQPAAALKRILAPSFQRSPCHDTNPANDGPPGFRPLRLFSRERAGGICLAFQHAAQISFGLRFLRQNIPGIEILEYPTRAEYRRALKRGWDAVGFSFYLEESNEIVHMAEEARRRGSARMWAGNYGALTPSLHGNFDEVFSGYSEDAVAQALGTTIGAVQHPPLVSEFRLPGGWPMPVGVLFTTRGCSFSARFARRRRLRRGPRRFRWRRSSGQCDSTWRMGFATR